MSKEYLKPNFGNPQGIFEKAAYKWLIEHAGTEGESVMKSLAKAMEEAAAEYEHDLAT